MTVKAVIFDLDDTLLWDERCVKEAFYATCQIAELEYGIDPEKLEEAVRQEARALYESYDFYPFTQNIGINPFEGLWGQFKDEHDPNFARMRELVAGYRTEAWTRGLRNVGIGNPQLGERLGETFPYERRKLSIVYPDTYAVLDQLKGKYKLLLLTNGSPDLQNEKLSAEPMLEQYFDHIVISGNFGQGKPAKPLFDHVLQLLDIQANEGIMIGDKLTTDIKGANGIGMPSVWINRHHVDLSGDARPNYIVESLTEVIDVINKING